MILLNFVECNVSSSDSSTSDLLMVQVKRKASYKHDEEELELVKNEDSGVPSSSSSSENEENSDTHTQTKEYREWFLSRPKDRTGLMMAPNCNSGCFLTADNECDHDMFRLDLTKVGDYCAFPALWWHHGYYMVDSGKTFYTAQLFATPKSDRGAKTRLTRNNTKHQNYEAGNIEESQLTNLTQDLFDNWDTTYSADKFPPAKKFQGIKVDRGKNRHILYDQIPHVPKIHQLVLKFEENLDFLTVNSVWIIKKTREDDGFQGWHQDMKHRITTTIVVNVGVVEH